MIYSDTVETELGYQHFSAAQSKAVNLGAMMQAANFEAGDNPYEIGDELDRYEAWWKGFNLAFQLKIYAANMRKASNMINDYA